MQRYTSCAELHRALLREIHLIFVARGNSHTPCDDVPRALAQYVSSHFGGSNPPRSSTQPWPLEMIPPNSILSRALLALGPVQTLPFFFYFEWYTLYEKHRCGRFQTWKRSRSAGFVASFAPCSPVCRLGKRYRASAKDRKQMA